MECSIKAGWMAAVEEMGGTILPTRKHIAVQGLQKSQALKLSRLFTQEIVRTSREWGIPQTLLHVPGESPIEIPSTLPDVILPGGERRQKFWTGVQAVGDVIFSVMADFKDNPRQGAVVRLHDEKQIIVGDPTGAFYPDPETAVQLCRAQYWDTQDLENMRRESRQSDRFTFTYLADDSHNADDWSRITTEFERFEDENGLSYHKCRVLGFVEIGSRNTIVK